MTPHHHFVDRFFTDLLRRPCIFQFFILEIIYVSWRRGPLRTGLLSAHIHIRTLILQLLYLNSLHGLVLSTYTDKVTHFKVLYCYKIL